MFFRRLIIISNTSSREDVSSNRELSETVVRSVDALRRGFGFQRMVCIRGKSSEWDRSSVTPLRQGLQGGKN